MRETPILGPLGQNVHTLTISCQRLPSLLRLYLNMSYCATICFAYYVFLNELDALKNLASRCDMDQVSALSMQGNQVEKASETCAQASPNDEQSERPSRFRIGGQEHENGLRGMAQVNPVEGVSKL